MQSAIRDIHAGRLLILDFGSQYTQLIARRVRECGVYCEIYPFDVSDEVIHTFAPAGVILSGGPETVTKGATPRIPESIFALEVPVLGICYGLQALASQLGGEVVATNLREFGHSQIQAEKIRRQAPIQPQKAPLKAQWTPGFKRRKKAPTKEGIG